ncbi:NADP-dependent oxidoreductase [Bailinhaonella thermotolerans]|uniref:NADP-dependent oxidoreductase n=1 Tax=Bailinhaonella thermotolerans TaxID=1070861 RepID=A0A3A4AZX3_9ACTN|nr:NADP-dependent oxidoreductase [Bailinhaonella thermotolerans]RJL33218.1 NADP-dependent oxidoreductase [Bailinhaonella thermotolerans]
MRAVVVRNPGGLDALEVVDVAVPEPGPGQVRVRVEAAAVNPVDVATRAGLLVEGGLVRRREQHGIGWDVAGVIDALGPGVTGVGAGDRVIGLRDRLELPLGTHAEYVVLDAGAVARAPGGVSAEAAATIPLNGLTAMQGLDLLGLSAGQTLLVTGAAGALGGFAVELAAARGLRVVALASPADEEAVRGFGAEFFVPRGGDLPSAVRALVPGGVDGVLDAAVVGSPALEAARGGGSFVSVVAGAAPLPLRGTRVREVWIRADAAMLGALSALAESGRLTLRVASTHALEDAAKAHALLEQGGLRGRPVLTPGPR